MCGIICHRKFRQKTKRNGSFLAIPTHQKHTPITECRLTHYGIKKSMCEHECESRQNSADSSSSDHCAIAMDQFCASAKCVNVLCCVYVQRNTLCMHTTYTLKPSLRLIFASTFRYANGTVKYTNTRGAKKKKKPTHRQWQMYRMVFGTHTEKLNSAEHAYIY